MTRRFFNLLACGATAVPAVAAAPAPRKRTPGIPGLGGLAAQSEPTEGQEGPATPRSSWTPACIFRTRKGNGFSSRRDLNELGANK